MKIHRRRCPEALFNSLANNHPKGVVLDLGCGSGVILNAMERLGLRVVGVDISQAAIDICNKLSQDSPLNHEFHQCDLRDFEIRNNYYTAIVAMTSLVGMRRKDLMIVLEAIKSGLMPGGVAYIEGFTVRDPIFTEQDKFLPAGDSIFFHPQWNSFMYLFQPGELLFRFREFEIIDYKELYSIDLLPYTHRHHEARLCCRKPRDSKK